MQNIIIIAITLAVIALAVYFCLFHNYNQSRNAEWTEEQDDAAEAYLTARDKLDLLLDIHGVETIVGELAHLDCEVA